MIKINKNEKLLFQQANIISWTDVSDYFSNNNNNNNNNIPIIVYMLFDDDTGMQPECKYWYKRLEFE